MGRAPKLHYSRKPFLRIAACGVLLKPPKSSTDV